jgi:hypothetical protein
MSKYRAFVVIAVILVASACSNANYNYMREGQPFAEAIVRDVGESWDAEKLISKADPEMMKDHSEAEIRTMIAKCGEALGPLTEVRGLAGEVNVAGGPANSILYTLAVKGQKLNARVRITLRKSEGDWKVLGFWVKS